MSAQRKMAMLVGNTVVGDSRVEKAAISAKKAGYDVYLVGIKDKTVPYFGSYRSIPILRPLPDWSEYIQWRKQLPDDAEPAEDFVDRKHKEFEEKSRSWSSTLARYAADAEAVRAFPHLIAPNRFAAPTRPARDWTKTINKALRPVNNAYQRGVRATVNARNMRPWLRSGVPGEWRDLWPQISGFEGAFLQALRAIEPDIIHVHDRHPMSAAATYQAEMAENGKYVPWVYDAHEYLPGQRFSGPAQHRFGWLNLEADMIRRADATITVSEQLAGSLAERHHLDEQPFVVENAPVGAFTVNSDPKRASLREELGIPDNEPLAIYVGKLAERRGVFDAVAAAAKIPRLHLAFVGSRDAAPRKRILQLGNQFKIRNRLHIVDYVPSRNVTSYISSADLGLSPLFSTPAHEQALATKIREYIVSGLPIVGSDLKAQGQFIRKFEIGELHAPNDPADMARAIERALKRLPELKQNVDSIREQHTWENQETSLSAAWEKAESHASRSPEISGSSEVTPEHVGVLFSKYRLRRLAPLFAAVGTSQQRVAFAVKSKIVMRTENGAWEVLGPAAGEFQETFSTWSKLVKRADALVATDFEPLFVETMGAGACLANELKKSGIAFFNWTSLDTLGFSNGEFVSAKAERAVETALQIASKRASALLTADPSVLLIEPTAKWLPPALPSGLKIKKQDALADTVTVLVAARSRTIEEQEALNLLRSQFPMFDFVEVDGSARVEGTIFIDSLSGGVWDGLTEQAFKEGIPVLADYDQGVISYLGVQPPYIPTPVDLLSINLRLALSGRIESPDPVVYFEQRENLRREDFRLRTP